MIWICLRWLLELCRIHLFCFLCKQYNLSVICIHKVRYHLKARFQYQIKYQIYLSLLTGLIQFFLFFNDWKLMFRTLKVVHVLFKLWFNTLTWFLRIDWWRWKCWVSDISWTLYVTVKQGVIIGRFNACAVEKCCGKVRHPTINEFPWKVTRVQDVVHVVIQTLTINRKPSFTCVTNSYNYEFWLSLWKIVRSSVILLLPLLCVTYDSFVLPGNSFIAWPTWDFAAGPVLGSGA
jgi:hypothetical protein